jgi:hypothetical protein
VVVTGLLLGGCQWAMYGFGPGRTGSNPIESTIGLGNVAQLQLRWTAAVTSPVSSPEENQIVVANNLVYAAIAPGVHPATVDVFDAAGVNGCAGTPKVCAPLWTYALGSGNNPGSPVVVGGMLYVFDLDTTYAFDASGTNGCGGSPKVCQPLWSAPGGGNDILVDQGKLFVVDIQGASNQGEDVLGYDAAGSNGCGGSPKVCSPVWRGTVPSCGFATRCSPSGALMAAGGRLYEQVQIQGQEADFVPGQVWFDEAGSVGCSGSPPTCVGTIGSGGLVAAGLGGAHGSIVSTYQRVGPDTLVNGSAAIVDVTDPSSNLLWSQVVEATASPTESSKTRIGKPAVVGPTAYLPVGTGTQAWGGDQPTTCSPFVLNMCQPLWRTTSAAQQVTVANGVLFDDAGRAYDAAGSVNCSGAPKVCTPVAQIGPVTSNSPGTETQIVNGWVYRRIGTTLQAYHLP